MKAVSAILVCSLALTSITSIRSAEDKSKETTLKGTILCSMCALKETTKCQTAIQVKEGEKTVTYYFDDKGADEEHHEPVCGGQRKQGSVVGKVSEREGKKYIVPSKVEYAK